MDYKQMWETLAEKLKYERKYEIDPASNEYATYCYITSHMKSLEMGPEPEPVGA